VDGFVLVHSGRPVLAGGEPVQRNEGVGILLNSTMTTAWRNSGECWRAISSTIVSVCIQIQGCSFGKVKKQKPDDKIYLSAISVYAPTFCSPQEYKDQFYDDLMCNCIVHFVAAGTSFQWTLGAYCTIKPLNK